MTALEALLAQVEARRSELGLSQAQLGMRAFGRADSSIVQNMRRGSEPTYSKLAAIADALGLELYFGPRRETGPVHTMDVPLSAHETLQFATVPRYDTAFSAGPGIENIGELPTGAIAFRRDWMEREDISAGSSVVVSVRGDSMLPTLHDGDLVLIDRRKTTPHGRRIFALIGPDGEARIKRVEKLPNMLLLHSENDTYPTEVIQATDAERVQILGEVVWWGHAVRE